MVWELGAGQGHLGPLLTLAEPLKAAGHEVMFAARDTGTAERVLGASGMRYFQAPIPLKANPLATLQTYAQILRVTALDDVDEVLGRVRAWRALYALTKPDVLVCDHSPTALLAARGLDIRCIIAGTGFVTPPDATPFPDLRPWMKTDPAQLARDEAAVLDDANRVLKTLGAPPLERLGQLTGSAAPALFTVPELDPYAAQRRDADYWGPLPSPSGAAPRWPEAPGKRVFLYSQVFDTLPAVLKMLREGPNAVLAYVPKLTPEERARHQGGHLAFSERALDIRSVTRECDVAVMTTGHGTTTSALLAGKPCLLLPRHLEMLLIANAVERMGAGLSAPGLKPEGIRGKLDRLLAEPAFTRSAADFAERHRDLADAEAPRRKFGALIRRLTGGA